MTFDADPGRELAVPPRLVNQLDRLLRARTAVVSGPVGHGKRDLVIAWLARHREHRAHWLHEPGELAAVRALLDEPSPEGNLVVAVVSTDELIADTAFVTAALELAERQPRLRLVFVGRSRPEAALGSLAARGLLVDIDADQLVWTRAEVLEALTPMTPHLTPEGLDTIMSSCRGWPAIVRMLAAEPLTWSHTSKVTRLADSYISEEVLAGLDPADLQLLQELSALPTLDPLGAAWMTGRGDAAAQLSRLQAHGVPISWDDGNTIRLNPMLRGHLSRQLARETPQLHQELNQRAALWLRSRGRTLEAISLTTQVGLVDVAWMLAAEYITTTMHRPEMVSALPNLVEMMPPGWELDTVRSIGRGLATPQTMIAQLHAVDAQQMIARNDTGRFGYASFVLGMVRRVGYPEDADISLALELAANATSQGVHELDLALLSCVHTEYGLWLLHQGQLAEAQEMLLSGLGMARVVTVPWVIVLSLGALAFIHAEQGAVQTAQRLAEESLTLARERVFTTDSLDEFALLALALTAADTGDLTAAQRWFDELDTHDDTLTENDAIRVYVRATLLIARDDAPGALRLVRAYRDEPRATPPPFHRLAVRLAGFNAAIAVDDISAARAEYEALAGIELPDMQIGRVVLQARLALAQGDARTAHALLQPVVREQERMPTHAKHMLYLLMIYGVAADELHRTDEALQAFQRAGVLADRLGLNAQTARHTRVAVDSRREVPLTEAERHVLAHLDSARTLGETSEELFISLNTLKTHLRRIYRKLGVANREEAIEKAQVMGIRKG